MKKILTTFLFTLISILPVFALPGFTPQVPHSSGEYVFYQDKTFNRESYIGILYYDDSVIQIRYAAPLSKELSLPEKDIALLISIDPNSDYLNMTGERILTKLMPTSEDTDIVNYLHDLLYEFTSRRGKVDSVTQQDYIVSQEYPQFGDGVSITFDAKVPLFNIKNIMNNKGEKVFECVTFGQLTSSEDNSFKNFFGFPEIEAKPVPVLPPLPTLSSKKSKNVKAVKYKFENQIVNLDENWEQKMENAWILGDESFVTVSQIPAMTNDRVLNENFLLRKILQSTENSYVNFLKTEITYNDRKCQYKLRSKVYQPGRQTYVQSVKILTSQQPKKGFISETSTAYDYFSISTYQDAYADNPTYFEKVVRNYRSN